jgi:SAM-dependent methyltransferase
MADSSPLAGATGEVSTVRVQPVAAASFRDPAGFLVALDHRLFRLVHPGHLDVFERFLESPVARVAVERRSLVATRRLDPEQNQALRADPRLGPALATAAGTVFEHERIPFPSFAYEWPSEMLHAAATWTLDLARQALAAGFTLKDATPYNILFRGPKPVFVDLLSFETHSPGETVWRPYAQFMRTFILPLLAGQRWGIGPADLFLTRRDGLEPETLARWCGPLRRLLPPFLGWVTLPALLARPGRRQSASLYHPRPEPNPAKARFILDSLFARLARALDRVRPAATPRSGWSEYMETHSYAPEAFRAKETFVRQILEATHPAWVLDVGANTGHFSQLAAAAGASVVAIDSDPACVGSLWRAADARSLDILPLVIDFSRPSPAVGWRNRECPAFLDRVAGRFDCVLMLAVVHHLLVAERIPLAEIVDLAASLTRRDLILEFVGPGDSQFQRLTRGREHLHADLTPAHFEAACRERFTIERLEPLADSERRLYWLRRR